MNTYLNKIKKYLKKILPKNIKIIIAKILKLLRSKHTKIPKEELRIFELLKDSIHVVFDIGAREDLSFFNIKKDCAYHLFEPNKKFFETLSKKVAKLGTSNIIINEFGLSDKNEDNCIYYEDSQSFVKNPYLENTDTGQRYSLKKLDDYVDENKISYINFLKIDAEGMDYRIMLGGINIIREKTDYIQFEYWDGVKKFVDLLNNTFDLYLMMEPVLLDAILNNAGSKMTKEQKQIDYSMSIVYLNNDVIKLIDDILIPHGYGGNILGIKKNITDKVIQKLNFQIK